MISTFALIGALLISTCQEPAWHYTDYGRMSMYDPAKGGWNCDGDCTTVSMGLFHEAMYGQAGACPADLYGATVYFPYLNRTMHCVDQGPAIRAHWIPWAQECGVYFDWLMPLAEEPAPEWAMWYLEWEVVEWGGAWDWYQEQIVPLLEGES